MALVVDFNIGQLTTELHDNLLSSERQAFRGVTALVAFSRAETHIKDSRVMITLPLSGMSMLIASWTSITISPRTSTSRPIVSSFVIS